MKNKVIAILLGLLLFFPTSIFAIKPNKNNGKYFQPVDVFQLEYASDPQISPDGNKIVYVRNFMDIMTDRRRSNLWIINYDGTHHRPLTTGNENDSSPRWSPDGSKLLYVSSIDGSRQLYLRWMDTGQTAKLTNLTSSPVGFSWSPDGKWIAFSMMVREPSKPFAKMPAKPNGASWAKPSRVIDKLQYRADGRGYLENGYTHLFVLSAEGGTPRQITSGDFNHGGVPAWTNDGKSLIFSANCHEGWEYDPVNSEVHEVSLADGKIITLTDRQGPDGNPVLSPDGNKIAYVGFDNQQHGYHITRLYVMNRDGSGSKVITANLDRRVQRPYWSGDNKSIFFQYDDQGNTKISSVTLAGEILDITDNIGGLSLGRPYGGGTYSVSKSGHLAFTYSRPDRPADVAVTRTGSSTINPITGLNEDLLANKELSAIEEIWYESSHDGRKIQGWIVKPPGFDANKKHPLILEIHGGPFANYGNRFAAEIQLYAAAGYVVLYTNPRGSSSYGKEFGNLIHHAYPGDDYFDLVSGVDAVIAKGYIDEDNLFITGGSGGGVLTSWTIGRTNRFQAAVVQKPVINWYSFVLTADNTGFFYKYWFPGFPWDYQEHYMKRSPLSLVGNVSTPTMLINGESDYRTPISEAEQYYMALKLRKIDTALVRIPDASHGIAARPSNLIAKVAHILEWFERYRKE